MELILWRHAEAADTMPDSRRKLTAKGAKHAKAMAKWLRRRLPKNATVLSSPAQRALQTARALTSDFKIVKEIGAAASARKIISASGWPKGEATVVIVGHQPALGEAAALLLSGAKQSWSLKKGAVLWIGVTRDEKRIANHRLSVGAVTKA